MKASNSETILRTLMLLMMLTSLILVKVFQSNIASKIENSPAEYHKYTLTEKMNFTYGYGYDAHTENYFRVADENGAKHLLEVPSCLYLNYQENDEIIICCKTITQIFGEPYTLYEAGGCSVDFKS